MTYFIVVQMVRLHKLRLLIYHLLVNIYNILYYVMTIESQRYSFDTKQHRQSSRHLSRTNG